MKNWNVYFKNFHNIFIFAILLFYYYTIIYFFSVTIGEYIRVSSSYGPQVIFNHKEYGIRSRQGLEMDIQPLVSISEMVVTLVIVYYLLDLSYPSCFGQLLGFFQEICGFEQFIFISKKCNALLNSFRSNVKFV